ncbi:hypothetical protein ACMGD3_24330 [Lysinibacillus sphaericus]|uniref:hypothetical protein n=1 Tax=Lysinibacillus sphaericus TaxID=1421 RepID=UPI003F7AE1B9
MYENLMEATALKFTFGKEEVANAIKEEGISKTIAILYSHSGERYLGVGETRYCEERKDSTFIVEEVRGCYGIVKQMHSYDALGVCSKFMGIKILVSRGLVCNKVKTALSLFTNDHVLTKALKLVS